MLRNPYGRTQNMLLRVHAALRGGIIVLRNGEGASRRPFNALHNDVHTARVGEKEARAVDKAA